jgi:uncharacterized coiled-coil DUF342 family protein
MQRRYETTTLKQGEEKKMLAEIKKLKESIPNAIRLIELKPKIDEAYDQKTLVNNELNKVRTQASAVHEEIEKINKEFEDVRDHREDIKSQLDKFEEDITKVREEIAKFVENKLKIKEGYYQAKFEYEVEKSAIDHAEFIQKQKNYLIERNK